MGLPGPRADDGVVMWVTCARDGRLGGVPGARVATGRLAWALLAAVVALGLGAAPAAADNGPHVKGAGVMSDSCAGCPRRHTAKTAPLADTLTKQPQPALCYTCHGSTGAGADTDVEDGVSRTGAPG